MPVFLLCVKIPTRYFNGAPQRAINYPLVIAGYKNRHYGGFY